MISKFEEKLYNNTNKIISKIKEIFKSEDSNTIAKKFYDKIKKFEEEMKNLETNKYEIQKEIAKFKEEIKKCKEYIKKFNGNNKIVNEFEGYLLLNEITLLGDIRDMIPEEKALEKEIIENKNDDSFNLLEKELEEEMNENK